MAKQDIFSDEQYATATIDGTTGIGLSKPAPHVPTMVPNVPVITSPTISICTITRSTPIGAILTTGATSALATSTTTAAVYVAATEASKIQFKLFLDSKNYFFIVP